MAGILEFVDVPKKLRELEEKLAGSQYVAILLWVVLSILVRFELEKVIGLLALSVTLTFILYRLGSSLDDLVFDPIFRPETDEHPLLKRLGVGMRAARRNAACFLQTSERNCVLAHNDWEDHKPHRPPTKGIYKKADALYGGTQEWKQRVGTKLRVSKASRCFVIPLASVFTYHAWPDFLPRLTSPKNLFSAFTFLASRWAEPVSLVACLTVLFLYLFLRLGAMKALYTLITEKADLKQTRLQLKQYGPEEALLGEGYVYFISSAELRQVVRSKDDDQRYSMMLLLRGAAKV